MRLLLIVLTLVLFSIKQKCVAQSETIFLNCLLTNSRTNKPIAFAHIYNESQRSGVISDSNGVFLIRSIPDDTLVFLALGYYGTIYTVKEIDFDTILTIKLLPQSYEIEEVSINIPRTYQHFKQELLKINTEKDRPMPELPQYNKYKTPELLDTNVIKSVGFTIMHPVSGLYYRFSKEEKSKRKVWYAQQQELLQSAVDEKFNRELVSKITGLENNDLTQFIGYCNFSFNYLLESSPYEITLSIERIFREYLNCYDKKNNKHSED